MSERDLDAAVLRPFVAKAVGEASFYAIAKQIGISQSTLHAYVNGAVPHYYTLAKIHQWAVDNGYDPPPKHPVRSLTPAEQHELLQLLTLAASILRGERSPS